MKKLVEVTLLLSLLLACSTENPIVDPPKKDGDYWVDIKEVIQSLESHDYELFRDGKWLESLEHEDFRFEFIEEDEIDEDEPSKLIFYTYFDEDDEDYYLVITPGYDLKEDIIEAHWEQYFTDEDDDEDSFYCSYNFTTKEFFYNLDDDPDYETEPIVDSNNSYCSKKSLPVITKLKEEYHQELARINVTASALVFLFDNYQLQQIGTLKALASGINYREYPKVSSGSYAGKLKKGTSYQVFDYLKCDPFKSGKYTVNGWYIIVKENDLYYVADIPELLKFTEVENTN